MAGFTITFAFLFGVITMTTTPLRCGSKPWKKAKSWNETGGVVDINVTALGMTEVYCDMTTDGGSWIFLQQVFQRRMDGSEDFYRNWTNYVRGFGSRSKEFWLGLEAIHQLTKDGNHELRIDMIEENGTQYFAKYSSFKVGSSSAKYNLTADGFSGNATNAFQYHSGRSFSTRDQDNDRHSLSCADMHKGGWWYNSCVLSNLNGLFGINNNNSGIAWKLGTQKKNIFMKFSEMKLRKIKLHK